MRRYLFRGKRTDSGEWVEGYLNYNKPRNQYYIMDDVDAFPIPVHKESVGQYTGMNDKNGRKIFEGDIVKLTLIDGVEIGVIKFNDIMCRFTFYDKSGGWGFDNTCELEVIGTVFENADLLEG